MNRALALLLAVTLALPLHLVTRSAYANRYYRTGTGSRVGQILRDAGGAIRGMSRATKVTITGAVLSGLLATGLTVHHENARQAHIPLAFSEISHVEREAAANGVELPPLQTYLMRTNETVMKIFEANRDKLANPDMIKPGQVLTIPK